MKVPVFATLSLVVVSSACELAPPFEGPGYSNGLTSEAEGPFTVSTTNLILKEGDPDAQGLFDKNMEVLSKALPDAEGLVGSSLSITLFGSGYRTLSVWESEEAVLAWVTSEAHGNAMSEMADHSDPKSSVASWTMTRAELEEAPPSWDDAKARLDSDGREVY